MALSREGRGTTRSNARTQKQHQHQNQQHEQEQEQEPRVAGPSTSPLASAETSAVAALSSECNSSMHSAGGGAAVRVVGPRAAVESAKVLLNVVLEYMDRERDAQEGGAVVRQRLQVRGYLSM